MTFLFLIYWLLHVKNRQADKKIVGFFFVINKKIVASKVDILLYLAMGFYCEMILFYGH